MFKKKVKKVKKVKTNRAQANAQACKPTNREDKMTIQPFKNRSEKKLFEKELKDMILTPTSEHRKITKWQSATNRVHSKWCKDNGYSTDWNEVRVGRPKRQANK